MQRKSLFKGLLTTAFAAAMAVMVSLPAKAAPAAPALSIKNTVTSDKHVTAYTFGTQQVSNGSTIYFNVYKSDPKVSLTGSYHTSTVESRYSYAAKQISHYYDAALNRTYYHAYGDTFYYYDDELEYTVYTTTPSGSPVYEYSDGYEKLAAPIEYNYFSSDDDYDEDDYAQTTGDEYVMDITQFTPGTYQVTATLFDYAAYKRDLNAYKAAEKQYYAASSEEKARLQQTPGAILYKPQEEDYYSAASAPVTIKVAGGVSISTAVTSTSIQLDLDGIGKASGYEIYRKAGKKFVKIATTSKGTYTDSGLVSKTKYTYKVRPYYYDSVTKAKTMGAYTQVSATTNGSALNLKAQVKGTKNVVLTWSKITGATKYEIYRSAGYSKATVTKKGQTNAFGASELVATVKKNKKKYVDKKATAGEEYTYYVRAVVSNSDKKNSKKSMDVEEARAVSLKFDSVNTVSLGNTIVKADGSKVVQWAKVSGATGYVVEKKDPATGKWNTYKTLGKNATKITLPAAVAERYVTGTSYSDNNKEYTNYAWKTDDTYRICAVKGNTRSEAVEITVGAKLAAVSSVTATKTANGIQVSWTPVPNAAYYRVYRVMAGSLYSNKDGGYNTLNGSGWESVYSYSDLSPLTSVDPVNYNALLKVKQADSEDTIEDALSLLDEKKTYYYPNYSYKTEKITATSVLDYAGYAVGGSANVYDWTWDQTTQKWAPKGYCSNPVVVNDIESYHVGPQDGVSYQYYVEAVMATPYTTATYFECNPDCDPANPVDAAAANAYVTNLSERVVPVPNSNAGKVITVPVYDDSNIIESVGVKKVNTVTYTNASAPGKAKLKSVKSSKKKTVNITFKKVSGATSYKIYRSTKKKGKYTCVASVTKTKYADKTVESNKKYYYKVVAVKANEAGADVEGKASAVKAVKVK